MENTLRQFLRESKRTSISVQLTANTVRLPHKVVTRL